MLKESTITLRDGDHDITVRLRQMPATKAERFTIKLLMLIGGSEGGVKDTQSLMTALASAPYDKVQELLSELLSCASIVTDGIETALTESNVDGFVQTRQALMKIRAEAFKHNDFFPRDGLSGSDGSPVVQIKRKR